MQRTQSSPSSGRIRLTILLATVAAFLLVPVAGAFAANTLKVNFAGTGTGEVSSVGGSEGEFEGSPPISCSYKSPGPATGTCTDTMVNLGGAQEEFVEELFEIRGVELTETAKPGSAFVGWTIEEGNEAGGAFGCQYTGPPEGAHKPCLAYAFVGEDAELTATFEKAFSLTVTKSGAGAGTVTSAPAGIKCGATCGAEFAEGSSVTLSQNAEPGSKFVEWTGACSGTGTCKVTMSAVKSVGAKFELEGGAPTFSLTVTKSGTGTGTVTSTPAGIDCGSECEAEFEEGKEVELSQSAETGSEFVEWGGACSGSGSCEVTMDEAKEVTAKFELEGGAPTFTLTVTRSGTGTGTVTSTPAGISCGSKCEKEFEEGKEVELTQAPTAGSKFVEWTGACSGTGACEVTMSAVKSVGAKFDLVPKFKLTVTKSGTGSGKVTSTPAGISCEPTCSAEFEEGKEVELKEAPEAGSEFKEWSGACTGSGTCKVTMSSAKSVTAEFKLAAKPKFTLKVKKTGTGSGKVESTSPLSPKIICGSECEKEFEEGTKVTLTQSAGAGSKFIGWSGACTGSGACEVTMSAAKEVSAKFDLVPKFKLTVTKSGTGSGKVTSTPAGISCEPTCSAEFEEGKEVELKEAPEAGSEFKEWSGACTGSGTCKVTMSSAKSVGAKFDLVPKPKFTLTVTKSGTGTGTVTCDGGACASTYDEGTKVALAASASAGSTFAGFSGAGCSGIGNCVVTISADTTVTATFNSNPSPPPPPAEEKCVVPKLAKKSLGQAKSALKAAHCTLGKVTKPKPKKGKKLGPLVVKSSSPPAGTTLPAGSKVNLKLAPKAKKKH